MTGREDGYATTLLLVTVAGEAAWVHFQAGTCDVVWMMLGMADADTDTSGEWMTRVFEYRAEATICGLEPLEPTRGVSEDEESCAACMAGIATAMDEGVARLAARWAATFPGIARTEALAAYRARYRQDGDAPRS